MPSFANVRRRTLRALPWLAAAALAAAVVPFDAKPPPTVEPVVDTQPTAQAGRIVFKDPVTGAFRAPTPEEYQALFGPGGIGLGVKTGAMPPEEIRPDGTRRLRIRGHAQAAIHATVDEHGGVHVNCGEQHTSNESEGLR